MQEFPYVHIFKLQSLSDRVLGCFLHYEAADVFWSGDLIRAVLYVSVVLVDSNIRFGKLLMIVLS